MRATDEAAEQGDEADEAFAGTPSGPEVPAHARAGLGRMRAPLRSLSPVFDRLSRGRDQGKTGEEAMPSVRIETRRWMTRETKRAVLDAVHASLVTAFKIPEHDRNQRLVEFEPEDFEASAGKGEHFTVVTVDAFAGRSLDAKRALYRELVSRLAPLGIPGNDLLVIVHDVPLESWGTRGGQAACDIDIGFQIKV